jgi:hypothetical protein
MNLPALLQQLEQGSISAAQAEQQIRDEIERVESESDNWIGRSVFMELKKRLGLRASTEQEPVKE